MHLFSCDKSFVKLFNKYFLFRSFLEHTFYLSLCQEVIIFADLLIYTQTFLFTKLLFMNLLILCFYSTVYINAKPKDLLLICLLLIEKNQ